MNQNFMKDISDEQLELVVGGHHHHHHHHHCATGRTTDTHVTIINNYYDIVYAPVYVYGTVNNSAIDNGNTYLQRSVVTVV